MFAYRRAQNLVTLTKQMFNLFGSTYICEQTFSLMKLNKNKQCSLLTDEHLEDILNISSSSIVFSYNVLVANKRSNISRLTLFFRFNSSAL